MAFKFNWSPLTTDASFYTRAQELLTTALNKSPRPPIIVDDIIVNELNLGHVPPELEILEIGDLAEDRFRGIFKMSYNGDAYLTLKTKVQANPLNTYLSTRDVFASPQPLAAATGLTIPLQITLSDIKLSAFIVLVFSRQKGLTLVFRNDPLESLKVSSTFDSIPFVRDYLQKEIDGQLRILLMDQLPAIIHRLSLRLWVPEYRAKDDEELADTQLGLNKEPVIDPLSSPPQDPVDSTGNPLNAADIASLSLDSSIETHSLFSQKNLLKLATLNDSHRTLSLFTPSIRDTVFRAWAGATERGDAIGIQSPRGPSLSRSHSYAASTSTTYTFTDNASQAGRSQLGIGLGLGGVRHSKPHRKRKKRVVNLRKKAETGDDGGSVFSGDSESYTTESVTESETTSAPSVFTPPVLPEDNLSGQPEPSTPPLSPLATIKARKDAEYRSATVPSSVPKPRARKPLAGAFEPLGTLRESPRSSIHVNPVDETPQLPQELDDTPRAARNFSASSLPPTATGSPPTHQNLQSVLSNALPPHPVPVRPSLHHFSHSSSPHLTDHAKQKPQPQQPVPAFLQFLDPGNSASIAEQAWMMRMANEVTKRYQVQKDKMERDPSRNTAATTVTSASHSHPSPASGGIPLTTNNNANISDSAPVPPHGATTSGLGIRSFGSLGSPTGDAKAKHAILASGEGDVADEEFRATSTPPPAYAA